jgi:hypothetical protein
MTQNVAAEDEDIIKSRMRELSIYLGKKKNGCFSKISWTSFLRRYRDEQN